MSFCVEDWGQLSYTESTARQLAIVEGIRSGDRGDTLIFVEHTATYSLGANFHSSNLLLSNEEYAAKGIEVIPTDRGGDVTYHGPGQLVIYPIFDLKRHGQDLHRWMRDLEETVMLTSQALGLEPRRFAPHTGVWIGDRKLAAIGVKIKQWISFHGIALNCSCDLTPFEWIVPCGIEHYGVTSLSQELGKQVLPADVKPILVQSFEKVFTGSY